ncbi:MAG TPA: YfhO family protein [Ruminococcus sp.]|nr:YfhO family protein [Ruminococcus sp.]
MANSKASGTASKPRSGSAGAKNGSKTRRPNQYNGKPARTAADVIAEAALPKSNLWFCIPAFIIPFVLTLISYIAFGVYPFGERSVLTLDLSGQYIYYFESLRDSIWGDSSPFYSWSRNLSGGFMGIIGYYLASPFTLIIMLLPRKMIVESMMIMQMVKVGSCGAAFCVYAQRSKHVAPIPSVMFSTMYAMMSYVVIQLIDPMWIDGPIFLPLIILGVEYLIDDGRKINYIIPLAIMFVANFYIGFMVAIFVAIYFFYYLFFGTNRKFKDITEYFYTFVNMGIATIVVLLCSMFMILPVYNALALGKFDFSEPDYSYRNLFKPLELVPCMLPNQYYSVNVDEGTRMYGRPEIYSGVMSFVMLPLYFMNRKIKLNRKIGNALLLFIMFMSMYVKPINMLWHGGQDPNWLPYRYSFIVSFIVIAMAADVFSKLDGYKLTYKEAGISFGIIALLTALFVSNMPKYNYNQDRYKYVAVWPYKDTMEHGSDKWDEVWLGTVAIGMVLATVYVIYLFAYSNMKKKSAKTLLTCAVAAVVIFEGGYNCYDSFRKIFKEVGNSDKSTYTEILSGKDVVDELEEYDGGFYRAEKTYSRIVNDNLALGLKGISHSSSVMNARAISFIEAMGYFTQSFESKYEGSNPVADSLLGIKYVLDDPDRSSSTKMLDSSYIKRFSTTYKKDDDVTANVDIYENPNALSIGYMVDAGVARLTGVGNDNPFNSLNNILSAMTGNTDLSQNPLQPKQYYVQIPVEVSYDNTKVHLHDYLNDPNNDGDPMHQHDCFEAYPDAGDAVVNVHLTVPQTGEFYMHLGSEVRKACNVWVSDTKDENGNFFGHEAYGTYFNTNSSPIVRIGPYNEGTEVEVRLTIQASGPNGRYLGQNEYLMVRKISGFNFYYLDKDAFEQDINLIKQSQWQIDTDKSNDRYLEGKITARQGQIMMTSIPYEPGWEIEVDGKKIDNLVVEKNYENSDKTYLTNKSGSEGEIVIVGSLIGIRLPEGEHTVTMKYTPPGFRLGAVAFFIGIACIVLLYLYDRKHNPVIKKRLEAKKRKKLGLPEETEEEASDKKKKNVQIIKSKGAVKGDVSENAKKKAQKAREEAEEIASKNEELLEKGKAYAEKAEDKAEELLDEAKDTVEDIKEKAEEKTAEAVKKTVNNTAKKSGNGNRNGKKKKKK